MLYNNLVSDEQKFRYSMKNYGEFEKMVLMGVRELLIKDKISIQIHILHDIFHKHTSPTIEDARYNVVGEKFIQIYCEEIKRIYIESLK